MTASSDTNRTELPLAESVPAELGGDESLLWGVFLCGLGLFLLSFLVSSDFRVLATSRFDLGPRAVPGAIGAVLLAGGIWEMVARRRKWLSWNVEQPLPNDGVPRPSSRRRPWKAIVQRLRVDWLRARSDIGLLHAYGLLGLLAAYLIGLPWIGFSLGSFLLAAVVMGKLGQRWWVALLASLGMIIVIKFLFTQLFEVPLPEGLLEGLV